MMLILQIMTICSSLHISTTNTSSREDRRSSSRTTRAGRVSQSDIRQVEALLTTLRKNPSNITWRNEANRKIQDIKKINPHFANRYQQEYDSITQGVTIESKVQQMKRHLDTQLNALRRNPNNPSWQKRSQNDIDALKKEDPNLATEYQAQLDAITGKTVSSTPIRQAQSEVETPYYGGTSTTQVSEADIKQMERILGLLKNNPTNSTWRNEATRYIKIIENSSPARAADYQKQYDIIVSGIEVESKVQLIKRRLDVELNMLNKTPNSSMWKQNAQNSIELLRNEDSTLADEYQARFDTIIKQ